MNTGSRTVSYDHRLRSQPVLFAPSIRPRFRPLWKVVPVESGRGRVQPGHGVISEQRYFPSSRMNISSDGSRGQLYPELVDTGSFSPKLSLDTTTTTMTFTQEDVNLVLYGRDYHLSRGGFDELPHPVKLNNGAGVRVKFSSGKTPAHSTYGVFSTIRLECGVRFGPYTGKKVYLSEVKSKDDNSRMWEVFINGQLSHFIDGRGACANWMTYVRCARTRHEQNLVVTQHNGQIYYEVCDVIEPNKELLVWYGEDYDLYLGIPTGLKFTHEKRDIKMICEDKREEKQSDQGYQCNRCGKMFAYTYYRDKHLKYTRCVDSGDRKFRCDLCPRSFEKRDRLRIHVLHVHEKHRPHSCHVCQKAFSQSSSLNKHMRVHNGERPYKCVFCGKSFTASSILRTHIRQHSGEKPFKCKFCGKDFASHAAHDSHVRRTHTRFERDPGVLQPDAVFPRAPGVTDMIGEKWETPTRNQYPDVMSTQGELTLESLSPRGPADFIFKPDNKCESGQPDDDLINVVE